MNLLDEGDEAQEVLHAGGIARLSHSLRGVRQVTRHLPRLPGIQIAGTILLLKAVIKVVVVVVVVVVLIIRRRRTVAAAGTRPFQTFITTASAAAATLSLVLLRLRVVPRVTRRRPLRK